MFGVQKQSIEVFYKISGVLKNFAKLTEKQIIKKENLKKRIPGNLMKFLRTSFLQNTSGRLYLKFGNKDNRGCYLMSLSIYHFDVVFLLVSLIMHLFVRMQSFCPLEKTSTKRNKIEN